MTELTEIILAALLLIDLALAATSRMLPCIRLAVSKWERGESVPDISVLKSIADLFGVTVDYLITSEHGDENENSPDYEKDSKLLIERRQRKHLMIMGMSILLVWLVAAAIFVPIDIIFTEAKTHWLAFVFAVPMSALVWLIFNSLWFNKRKNYLIISIMVWTLIISVYLTLLSFGHNVWQFYLFGIPGQLIIILWSKIGKKI